MRVFAGLCNNYLRVCVEHFTKFLFLLKNIYDIYVAIDILRISACFVVVKKTNKYKFLTKLAL